VRLCGHPLRECLEEPRFANPGLACQQDHLALTRLSLVPPLAEQAQLRLAPDKGGEPSGAGRCKAALDGALAANAIDPYGCGDTLECLEAEIFDLKGPTHQPPRALAPGRNV